MKANKDSSDWIEFVDDHIVCKVCGSRVERGIINVSGHWASCTGKETMDEVNAIDKSLFTTESKLIAIKQLFNLC